MKYIHKEVYTVLLILIFFSLKAYSEKTTIQILMKQPEVLKSVDTKNLEENYNTVINSFLLEEYKNNTTGNDIEVSFTFYKNNSEDTNNNEGSTYLNFIRDNIQSWTESKYDMAILDDRYLFNEESLIESIDIKEYFYTGMPTVNHFLNLSLYIDPKDIEHHDSDSLYHSHFKEDLYALPYEKDFDLLYFNSENGKSSNITESISSFTWDDLLVLMGDKSTNPLKIALKDDDYLLNFFFEYINSKYNISKESTEDYYDRLYNDDQSKDLLNSFRNFILSYTSKNLNDTLTLSLDDIYNAYINKETFLFKGKASHYNLFNDLDQSNNIKNLNIIQNNNISVNNAGNNINNINNNNYNNNNNNNNYINNNGNINNNINVNPTTTNSKSVNNNISNNNKKNNNNNTNFNNNIMNKGNSNVYKRQVKNVNPIASIINQVNKKGFIATLPPKNYSVVTEKYLVLNKYSNVDPNVLVDVALKLTSMKIQVLRSYYFGSIPTFDITKRNTDSNIKAYCDLKSIICDNLEKLQPIYMKDIFKSEFSSPFFETRVHLPSYIRNFLINNDMESLQFTLKSIKTLVVEDMGLYKIHSYIIFFIYTIFSLFIIAYTFKYRKHPYLKVIFPVFCIIMMIGFIMNMLSLTFLLYIPHSVSKCKISIMYNAINQCFVYIPIFAITYRIYLIYKSQHVYTKSLTNRNSCIAVGVMLLVIFIYKYTIIMTSNFYFISYGHISENRYPYCYYDNHDFHDFINKIAFVAFMLSMAFILFRINKISKRIGELYYIYIILGLNVTNYFVERKVVTSQSKNFPLYYLLLTILYSTGCFISLYYLVGNRLYFIIVYPDAFDQIEEYLNYNAIPTSNYVHFISLKADKNEFNRTFRKFRKDKKNIPYSNDYNISRSNRDSEISKYLLFGGISESSGSSKVLVKNYINNSKNQYSLSRHHHGSGKGKGKKYMKMTDTSNSSDTFHIDLGSSFTNSTSSSSNHHQYQSSIDSNNTFTNRTYEY